jgi:hypothetical protein
MAKTGTNGINVNSFNGDITANGTIRVNRDGELKRVVEYNKYDFLIDVDADPIEAIIVGVDSASDFVGSDETGIISIGSGAAKGLTNSGNGVFIGIKAGAALAGDTEYNTIVGSYAGNDANEFYDAVVSNNTFVGHSAGNSIRTGADQNTVMGSAAGLLLETGAENTFMGRYAGYPCNTGSNNISIGSWSGFGIKSGSNNTVIGHQGSGSIDNTLIIGRGRTTIDIKSDANGMALGDTTAAWADGVTVKNFVISNHAALDFADDVAAAAGGVPVGGVYHTSGTIKIRLS